MVDGLKGSVSKAVSKNMPYTQAALGMLGVAPPHRVSRPSQCTKGCIYWGLWLFQGVPNGVPRPYQGVPKVQSQGPPRWARQMLLSELMADEGFDDAGQPPPSGSPPGFNEPPLEPWPEPVDPQAAQ